MSFVDWLGVLFNVTTYCLLFGVETDIPCTVASMVQKFKARGWNETPEQAVAVTFGGIALYSLAAVYLN